MSETATISSTELAVIEQGIKTLKERAQAIQVKDQQGYMAACNLVLEGRSYIKDVKSKLGVGIDSAKRHLETLRNQLTSYVSPVEEVVKIAEKKAEDFKRQEREAAEREQRRINEERRLEAQRKADDEKKERERIAAEERAERERIAAEERKERERTAEALRKAGEIGKREADRLKKEAAEEAERQKKAAKEAEDRERERAAQEAAQTAANVQEVKVEPSVPKVAGIKARLNWKFRIMHETLIPRQYCKPDEVAIGAVVRSLKDKDRVQAMIPGIEVFTEDSI